MLNQHGSLLFVFQIPSPLFLIVESSSPDAPRTWRNFSPKTFLTSISTKKGEEIHGLFTRVTIKIHGAYIAERRENKNKLHFFLLFSCVCCFLLSAVQGTEAGAAGRTVRGLGRAWGAERRLGFSFPPLAEKCLG
ncbi:hypothetical protein ES332_A09G065600v1 [Gossypium tomentosum]|uniref:Uncharacterized protein n=1 Tax=Gossypium tomentosum TaxID=34277 RepID=A0A5D2NZ40_GOSTO|nr:hypothetical protein ES332_A09G065600v1 [Gossypium tomentosum]